MSAHLIAQRCRHHGWILGPQLGDIVAQHGCVDVVLLRNGVAQLLLQLHELAPHAWQLLLGRKLRDAACKALALGRGVEMGGVDPASMTPRHRWRTQPPAGRVAAEQQQDEASPQHPGEEARR